ncbi:hypothetical protein RQP46_001856 [Phenoliferia psychrophenolica]
MKPAGQVKRAGTGKANWGSWDDEITEGIQIVESGGRARGGATAAELGMAKLSTSAGSTTSTLSSKSEQDDLAAAATPSSASTSSSSDAGAV